MKTRYIYFALALAFAGLSTACGNSMQAISTSGSATGFSNSTPESSLKAVELAISEAEDVLQDAETEMAGLWQNNQIAAPDPGPFVGKVSMKSLTGLPEKLGVALDRLYAKITQPVAKAKAAITKARIDLATQLGKLDPANPAHALILKQLQDAVSKVEGFESRFSGVFKLLAGRGQFLLNKVDALILGVGFGGNPLGWIAAYELREVRNVLADFLRKLASL